MENNQVKVLIHDLQKVYIDELYGKIEDITKVLIACENSCTEEIEKKILRFFHSMHGSAATFDFKNLSVIGGEWEIKLKDLMNKGIKFDKVLIKDICKEVSNIKEDLDCLKDNRESTSEPLKYNPLGKHKSGEILLIDDDLAILKLLENALSIEGYKVHICDDSVLAFDMISSIEPDIVILDIMMPEIDGYELLKKIEDNPRYSDTYVIFLSAASSVEDRIKGIKLGADDYITKPFIIDEVLAKVEAALRRLNKYKEETGL